MRGCGRAPLLAAALACAATATGCNSGSSTTARHAPARMTAANGATTRTRRRAGAASDAASVRSLLRAGLPVYCGGPKPYAALTFDDGPGVYTRLALRILRAAHAPATFFLVGRNLAPFAALAGAEARQGEAFGNHTFTHPLLPQLPPAAVTSQLTTTSSAIRRATGVSVDLFRPPYEARSPAVDSIAQRLGLLQILWNVDSRDSLGANYAAIARNVEAGISPGAIVLMHENRGQTIRALKFYVLPALRKRHVKLVTVPQLLTLDPPSVAQLRRGRLGCIYHAVTTSGS